MKKKIVYLLLFILLSVTSIQILTRSVNLFGLLSWIIAIYITISQFWKHKKIDAHLTVQSIDIGVIVLSFMLFIALFTEVNKNHEHYHRDEFILSYTSLTLPPISQIDWFKGYPDDWVAQSPILYHVIQKQFLQVFGQTVAGMRASILPYHLGILIYLYYLALMLVNRKFAILTIGSYLFLACSLYFSTMALHHTSSTLFVLASVYHLILFFKTQNKTHNLLLLLWMTASLLTYSGSYVVFPIVLVTLAIQHTVIKIKKDPYNIRLSLVTFLVIMSPFIVHAAFIHNYFIERYSQVNTFTGSLSEYPIQVGNGIQFSTFFGTQAFNSLAALFLPGYGGKDGYYFGSQGLFNPLSFILFVVGGLYVLKKALQKNTAYIAISVTLVLSIVVGYIFTTQPPAFHRLSLLFPFFAICIALGVLILSTVLSFKFKWLKYTLAVSIIMWYTLSNLSHASAMIANDLQDYAYSTVVAEKIQQVIPIGSTIYIAAYPGFHFGQELLFRTNNLYIYITNDKDRIFSDFSGNPLLIINPTDDELTWVQDQYPDYHYIYYENTVGESLGFFYPPR